MGKRRHRWPDRLNAVPHPHGGEALDKPATMRFVTVAILMTALIAGVVALTLRSGGSGGGLEIIVPSESSAKDIVVYVTGQIALEGLYTLREGDRVGEAAALAVDTPATLDVNTAS